MKKTCEIVLGCRLLHELHEKQIVIDSQRSPFKERGYFMLGRGHLIMPRFDWNPQADRCLFKCVHESQNPMFYGTKIVIFHLLPFGGRCSTDCAPREH